MSTYTQIIYHVVFGTKDRAGTLDIENHPKLYAYIAKMLANVNCKPYTIGGHTEHIHILFALHPLLSLSQVVKDIKLASSQWMKADKVFAGFDRWQEGYAAFTVSWALKDEAYRYIENQHQHHKTRSFEQEYADFLKRAGIEFNHKHLP